MWASIDHKPTDVGAIVTPIVLHSVSPVGAVCGCCVLQDAEKRRIVDAGCKVFSGRVNGDLAVWLCVCVGMDGRSYPHVNRQA